MWVKCARTPCTVFQYTFWSIKSQWLTEIFWRIFLQKSHIQTAAVNAHNSRSIAFSANKQTRIHTHTHAQAYKYITNERKTEKKATISTGVCVPSMNERKQNKTHRERVRKCYWRLRKRTNERTNVRMSERTSEKKTCKQYNNNTQTLGVRCTATHHRGTVTFILTYITNVWLHIFVTLRKIVIVVVHTHHDQTTQATNGEHTPPHRLNVTECRRC